MINEKPQINWSKINDQYCHIRSERFIMDREGFALQNLQKIHHIPGFHCYVSEIIPTNNLLGQPTKFWVRLDIFASPVREFEELPINMPPVPAEHPEYVPQEPEKPCESEKSNVIAESTIAITKTKLTQWLEIIEDGRNPAVLFSMKRMDMLKDALIKRGDCLDWLKDEIEVCFELADQ